MIVDTSALMAILLDEPEQDCFIEAMVDADYRGMSAGTWVELGAVLTRSRRSNLFPSLDLFAAKLRIAIEPTSAEQAEIAHQAYRTFGIGTGHPARLNFGDCFAYALAKETGRPLLFKGDDFIHTDITPAV